MEHESPTYEPLQLKQLQPTRFTKTGHALATASPGSGADLSCVPVSSIRAGQRPAARPRAAKNTDRTEVYQVPFSISGVTYSDYIYSQPFTTGPEAEHFAITSITLMGASAQNSLDITVRLEPNNSNDNPAGPSSALATFVS